MTRRRWIADSWDEYTATLSGSPAAHLARVLRAQPGMRFDIVAGDRVRRGVIVEITDLTVEFALEDGIDRDPPLPITLLLAVFKFDRLEWVIEKATELGVARVVPVIARRTEKHLAQAAQARVQRWRRIAREAAQQSRRSQEMTISDPLQLKDAVSAYPDSARLLLSENERSTTLRDAVDAGQAGPGAQVGRHFVVGIGPEGGWASEEEALFTNHEWKPVTLGPRILRAETAAIATVSVLAALLE